MARKLSYYEKLLKRKVLLDESKFLARLWLQGELSTDNLIKTLLQYKRFNDKLGGKGQ